MIRALMDSAVFATPHTRRRIERSRRRAWGGLPEMASAASRPFFFGSRAMETGSSAPEFGTGAIERPSRRLDTKHASHKFRPACAAGIASVLFPKPRCRAGQSPGSEQVIDPAIPPPRPGHMATVATKIVTFGARSTLSGVLRKKADPNLLLNP